MNDTVSMPGPELMRRIARVREQLEEAIAGLGDAARAIEPADTGVNQVLAAGLKRSIETIEQALDHLDDTEQAALGKAKSDEP